MTDAYYCWKELYEAMKKKLTDKKSTNEVGTMKKETYRQAKTRVHVKETHRLGFLSSHSRTPKSNTTPHDHLLALERDAQPVSWASLSKMPIQPTQLVGVERNGMLCDWSSVPSKRKLIEQISESSREQGKTIGRKEKFK
ncbi:hypothetical protein TNCV_1344771 [Trichonephila clavipes]|nr:hypothetical protein TNCV_1344771 [Trichonephila clavipes]